MEGKWILYIQVPESSSVYRCKGVVYDRGADGDFKLKEPERIAVLTNKKKGYYSEARVYHHLEISDLDAAVIPKIRNRIYSKNSEHPWLSLSDEEMLTRAGLIKNDIEAHACNVIPGLVFLCAFVPLWLFSFSPFSPGETMSMIGIWGWQDKAGVAAGKTWD